MAGVNGASRVSASSSAPGGRLRPLQGCRPVGLLRCGCIPGLGKRKRESSLVDGAPGARLRLRCKEVGEIGEGGTDSRLRHDRAHAQRHDQCPERRRARTSSSRGTRRATISANVCLRIASDSASQSSSNASSKSPRARSAQTHGRPAQLGSAAATGEHFGGGRLGGADGLDARHFAGDLLETRRHRAHALITVSGLHRRDSSLGRRCRCLGCDSRCHVEMRTTSPRPCRVTAVPAGHAWTESLVMGIRPSVAGGASMRLRQAGRGRG